MTPERFKWTVAAAVARGEPARNFIHAARHYLGDEAEAFLASFPATPVATAHKAHGAPQRTPLPACVHLGRADPNQPGVPCGQKIRECHMFGECTVQEPCAEAKAKRTIAHWCVSADGRRCHEYEAKENP